MVNYSLSKLTVDLPEVLDSEYSAVQVAGYLYIFQDRTLQVY